MRLLSVLRKSLKIKGFCFESCFIKDDSLFVKIRPRKGISGRCGLCGCHGTTYDTRPVRKWRHISLWRMKVFFIYEPRRINCRNCQRVVTEKMPWSMGKCHLTRSLIIELVRWSRELSWKTVADFFDVNWDQVQKAVTSAVEWGLEHRDTEQVTLLGIDEISQRKRHHYLTVVYELCQGQKRLLWVGEGRCKKTLELFFESWGPDRCKQIKGVCCDMWDAYVSTVRKYVPDAVLVFDKFHIVKHINDAVDNVRREEIRDNKDQGADELKGTRYIWLKHPKNLSDKQLNDLYELEKANFKTHRAWLVKETFRYFWKCKTAQEAERVFDRWFNRVLASGLKPMTKVAWMLKEKMNNILTIFEMPINNAATEGLNNKAKAVSHRSYGFKKPEVMSIALMNAMGNLELPTP